MNNSDVILIEGIIESLGIYIEDLCELYLNGTAEGQQPDGDNTFLTSNVTFELVLCNMCDVVDKQPL